MSAGIAVAVIGRVDDVAAVACAAATVIARRSAPRAALVVAAGPAAAAGPSIQPASRPARALRDRVVARGVPARAGGRLAWCAPAGEQPVREVRLAAACGPAVLAICGPRDAWVEPLLGEAALLLVAGPADDAPTALALAGLRDDHPHAVSAAVPRLVGAPRLLARAGLGGAAAWERPVHDLLEALA